jgi:hypothetical protein
MEEEYTSKCEVLKTMMAFVVFFLGKKTKSRMSSTKKSGIEKEGLEFVTRPKFEG